MDWKTAIQSVLQNAPDPMHYSDIANEIAERGLRDRDELGATPASSVAAIIVSSLKSEGDASPFIRTSRGYYALRSTLKEAAAAAEEDLPESASSSIRGVVNAFGTFWERSKVLWNTQPRLLGQQQTSSKPIDFADQKGVYLLHDAQGVVYVGRVVDQGLGIRLKQHNVDRLNGRWTRFSWFGVYPVNSSGSLDKDADLSKINIDIVIATMEAVLIEGLEPRQNRRRGDEFQGVEFLQVEDPELETSRKLALVQELMNQVKLGTSSGSV
jgi:hypothetical protein